VKISFSIIIASSRSEIMYFARRYWIYGNRDEDVKRRAIQSADPSKLL